MKFLAVFAVCLASVLPVWAHEGHEHKPDAHLVFAGGRLHAHLIWQAGPAVGVESVLRLEFRDGSTHAAVAGPEDFDVSLFMPSMGHGSAPTAITRVLGDDGNPLTGVYRIANVYFLMGGDWEVRVVLKDEQGVEETRAFAVKIEDGSGHGNH